MEILTVRQALFDMPDLGGRRLRMYLFRGANAECLYFGISRRNLYERLSEHLGLDGFRGNISAVGRFILSSRPQSEDWTIELYRMDEWLHLVAEFHRKHVSLEDVERYAIHHLRPRFNVVDNYLSAPDVDEPDEAERKEFMDLWESVFGACSIGSLDAEAKAKS